MEDDRAQVDLGLAADIEESQMLQAETAAQNSTTDSQDSGVKQPKKRFVGRRAAAEAAAKSGVQTQTGESGALQSEFFLVHQSDHVLTHDSYQLPNPDGHPGC